jgi:hypothetical protein
MNPTATEALPVRVNDILTRTDRIYTVPAILKSGAGVRKRGDFLGKVTADGKFRHAIAASEDGSQTPIAVLYDDEIDATESDQPCTIYLNGDFNVRQLTAGAGIDLSAAALRETLAARGLFLHDSVAEG